MSIDSIEIILNQSPNKFLYIMSSVFERNEFLRTRQYGKIRYEKKLVKIAMKTIKEYAEMLRRRAIKCKKGQPMLNFIEGKSKRCNWTIMPSSYQKLLEEAKQLDISVSNLIDLILMDRYELSHLIKNEGETDS